MTKCISNVMLGLAIIFYIGNFCRSQAAEIVASSRGVVSSSLVNALGAQRTAGSYQLFANTLLNDPAQFPPLITNGTPIGGINNDYQAIPNPPGFNQHIAPGPGAFYSVLTAAGGYAANARTHINYNAKSWDSGTTTANVVKLLPTAGILAPFVRPRAVASVVDPATFQIPNFTASGIDVQVTIGLGIPEVPSTDSPQLVALPDPNAISYAEMQGSYFLNLVGSEFLFSFSWQAHSNNPSQSSFTFTSNPDLGLNDSAIAAAFLAAVSSSNGVHTLTSPFTISATVPVPPSQIGSDGTLTFVTDGIVVYEARVVPEPTSLALLTTLGGLGWYVRYRLRCFA